jgi:hypothetical protein
MIVQAIRMKVSIGELEKGHNNVLIDSELFVFTRRGNT